MEFDEDKFLGGLNDLMTVSYENSEVIRLMIEDMVDTYNPSEPLSDNNIKQFREEIDYILNK